MVPGPRRRIAAPQTIHRTGLGGAGCTAIANVNRAVYCRGAVARAVQQQLALTSILCERSRPLDFRACLFESAELPQQFAAHARQEMVVPQRSFTIQFIY